MNNKRKICVVFDIDDTMYNLMEPFEKAHKTIFGDGLQVDCTELFMKSRIYSDKVFDLEKSGEIRKEDAFYERIRLTYGDIGVDIDRETSEQFEMEYRQNQNTIQMFDFMREILDYCRNERILGGALTNGRSAEQRKKAESLGLSRWIREDQIFVSGELGYPKPDVRAFRVIEKNLKLQPEQMWYVGDAYELDVVGAGSAGWHTIWFNHRKRECPDAKNMAEKTVECGEELLHLIKSL